MGSRYFKLFLADYLLLSCLIVCMGGMDRFSGIVGLMNVCRIVWYCEFGLVRSCFVEYGYEIGV